MRRNRRAQPRLRQPDARHGGSVHEGRGSFEAAARSSRIALTAAQREALAVEPGDTVFIDDARWWLGGLRSARGEVSDEIAPAATVRLPPDAYERNKWQPGRAVVLSRVD